MRANGIPKSGLLVGRFVVDDVNWLAFLGLANWVGFAVLACYGFFGDMSEAELAGRCPKVLALNALVAPRG
jgi:hypothetical protein